MVLDGYVRVSSVRGRGGERFISPAVQREQIEGWIRLRGGLVGEVFEELDAPGARTHAAAARAGDRARRGRRQSGGLVVAQLDRFGRSLIDGLAAIERIQRAGGTFVSVDDGFDLATDTGRLVMRMMLSMAEWQRDRVRARTGTRRASARSRAACTARRGRRPATGAGRRGGWSSTAASAPLISELFARRARGRARSMALCRWLEARGVRTPYGNAVWNPTSVRRMLVQPRLPRRGALGHVRQAPARTRR